MATNDNIQTKIKKYFYSSVGLASHSSDIVKGVVHEFVSQGKVSEKEGEKIVNEAIKKIEARYNEATQKLGKYATDEIAMLRKKVEGLEKKIATKSPAAGKAIKAVKKAAAPVVKKAAKKAAPIKKAVKAAAKKAAPRKAAKKAAKRPAAKKARA